MRSSSEEIESWLGHKVTQDFFRDLWEDCKSAQNKKDGAIEAGDFNKAAIHLGVEKAHFNIIALPGVMIEATKEGVDVTSVEEEDQ